MKIGILDNKVNEIMPGLNGSTLQKTGTAQNNKNFISFLKDALYGVSDLQNNAAMSAQKFALGEQDYLHNTVIAYEKALLALQLTIEIRNKLVEAYQEITRMQM